MPSSSPAHQVTVLKRQYCGAQSEVRLPIIAVCSTLAWGLLDLASTSTCQVPVWQSDIVMHLMHIPHALLDMHRYRLVSRLLHQRQWRKIFLRMSALYCFAAGVAATCCLQKEDVSIAGLKASRSSPVSPAQQVSRQTWAWFSCKHTWGVGSFAMISHFINVSR